jgi:hypothetical protein
MKFHQIPPIRGGQDGAISGKYLFRFNHKGEGRVYDLELVENGKTEPISDITLDKSDIICPHCNSVAFGNEYFAKDDEFPLLYANIYNNHAKEENQLKGVCCVYRIKREGESFMTTLVQLIEIDFVEDATLWKAEPEKDGSRPYGNFAVDRENNLLYAFVMRNEERGTAYFAFDLPKLCNGEPDKKYGVKKVVLNKVDIKNSFVCPEHHYIQGACCHKGKIYSLEGFRNSPALRIIDPAKQVQESITFFSDFGITDETEFIDFYGEKCYYSDCHGLLFSIEFDN